MKIEKDSIIFNSGKERYANFGIIGISPRGGVFGGYDDSFWYSECDESEELTTEERIELAKYMILEWQKFKNTANKEKENL